MSNRTDRAEAFPAPDVDDLELVQVLKALADPTRLVIVDRLADGEEHPCTTDAYGLSIHKSTLSYHFKTLREAGITATRVHGREHSVRLRAEDLERRFPGLIQSILEASADSTP